MKTERAATSLSSTERLDPTLAHALYYGIGIAAVALCVVLGGLVLAYTLVPFDLPPETLLLVLAAPLLGLGMGGVKLVQFTAQYRRVLYRVEEVIGFDLDSDSEIGAPGGGAQGTFLMSPDGTRKRLDTELNGDEVRAVKRQLLLSGKATVRGLTGAVGDRASALRLELIALGICAAPEHDRAPSVLTSAGRKAVMRW